METKREVWVVDDGVTWVICQSRIEAEDITAREPARRKLVRYVPASQPAGDEAGWAPCHALPSWLSGVFWLQFDDGSVSRDVATRDNGQWFYRGGRDKENASVIAYCRAAAPPPPRTGEGAGN